MSFLNTTTGWAGGFNGGDPSKGLYKYAGDPVGINAISNSQASLILYPNPATEHVIIQLANANENMLKISLTDMLGEKVYEQSFSKTGKSFTREMDVSNLSKGMYLVTVEQGTLYGIQKMILE
ncbi:MAG: T9SS type A sorting domain-containing protein [Chitinophagales bacterium]|nr:T9SS type A sorting domain-containing protein [Chitinophagales bacterium]